MADDDLWVDDLWVEDACVDDDLWVDDDFAESDAIGAEAPEALLVWAKAPKLTAEATMAAMRVFMKNCTLWLRWSMRSG